MRLGSRAVSAPASEREESEEHGRGSCDCANAGGRGYVYISTGHTGLYEKYGYEFYRMDKRISRAGIPVCTGKLWRWKVRTRIVATRMEPMPARHRQCLSENTEKRNSFRSMTNCMRPIPSKRRRKYWGRMYRRASRYWRNVLH